MLYFIPPWLFCNYQFVLLNPFIFFTIPLTHSSSPFEGVPCGGAWMEFSTSKWSEVVHWEYWLWGLPGGAGQDHLPLAWAKKWSADGCYLCWAWRDPGEAKPWTTAGCHYCQTWGYLVRSMGLAETRFCLFDFRKVWSMNQDSPFLWKRNWKQLGWFHCSPGQGGQWWPGWWRHRNGAHLLALWTKAQKRNGGLFQLFCLGESCPIGSCPDVRQFRFSWYVPGALWAVALALELRGSESE